MTAAAKVGTGWSPGAEVAWVADLGDRAELWDGTVWSPGPEPASVWVIPDEHNDVESDVLMAAVKIPRAGGVARELYRITRGMQSARLSAAAAAQRGQIVLEEPASWGFPATFHLHARCPEVRGLLREPVSVRETTARHRLAVQLLNGRHPGSGPLWCAGCIGDLR